MLYFIVEEDSSGLRLDQFLAKKLLLTREKVKEVFSHNLENSLFGVSDLHKFLTIEIVKNINIYCGNSANINFAEIQNLKNSGVFSKKNMKLSQKVHIGECFVVKIQNENVNLKNNVVSKHAIDSYNFKDWILFEDEHLLIINKIAGILSHGKPGDSNEISVVDLMRDYLQFNGKCEDIVGEIGREFVVHRLDKETSGLMILAKTQNSYQLLVEMFKNKLINKRYFGIVFGKPNPVCDIIKEYIGRDKNNRMKMHVCIPKVLKYYPDSKEAITHYFMKEVFENGRASLVEFVLETGRTHQIRAHMDFLGCPIVGDKLYGVDKNRSFMREFYVDRHMLHAYFLSFNHPIYNSEVKFEINLPDDMIEVANKLRFKT